MRLSRRAVEPSSRRDVKPPNRRQTAEPPNRPTVALSSRLAIEPSKRVTAELSNRRTVEPSDRLTVEPSNHRAVEHTFPNPIWPTRLGSETIPCGHALITRPLFATLQPRPHSKQSYCVNAAVTNRPVARPRRSLTVLIPPNGAQVHGSCCVARQPGLRSVHPLRAYAVVTWTMVPNV